MTIGSFIHSCKNYTLIFLCVGALVSFPVVGSTLTVPFGGRIVQMFPGCLFPPAMAVTIGPPTPMPLMYMPGTSFSFLNGPPAHPGQWLLGNASAYVPCIIMCGGFSPSPCPYAPQPGGLLILMHGSSM